MPEHPVRSYRFGRFRIDDSDRLLFRDGKVLPLPPRAVQTLLLLLSRPGHVWSKSELIESLWPGISVEEGSLTECIFQLRRTLRELHGIAGPIETIPRRGYRWVAPVEVSESIETPSPRRRLRSSARSKIVAGTIAGMLLAALGLTVIPIREPDPLPGVRPFTSYPGGEYEPAFSPDGDRLAFVWDGPQQDNFDIYVRNIDSDRLTRLTTEPAGEGSPAWSADGRSIAFVRYGRAGEPGVYAVSSKGGPSRKITDLLPLQQISDRLLDWSPSGDVLAFADKPVADAPYIIHLVRTGGGERTTLTRPPAESRGDTCPRFSPDGQNIAFKRTVSAATADIYVVPVTGGQPQRLTFDKRHIAALAWSASGKHIVFSSNRRGPLELWHIPANGGKPSQAGGLGAGANFLSISRRGRRLAWSHWFANTNLYIYDLPDLQRKPRQFAASTRAEMSPAWSQDGKHIAFRSDRSGTPEIWIAKNDGSDTRQLTSFGGPMTGSPAWSPDGRQIAFDSRPAGTSQIFVVDLLGRRIRIMTDASADNVVPCWSQDGRWIYFASNRSGNWQIWKVRDAGQHEPRLPPLQLTRNGGFAPHVLNGWIYYAKGSDSAGLWRVSETGDGERMILSQTPAAGLWGYWCTSRQSVFVVETHAAEPVLLRSGDGGNGQFQLIGPVPKPMIGDSGMTVSPDEKQMVYAKADEHGSDILIAEPFRIGALP